MSKKLPNEMQDQIKQRFFKFNLQELPINTKLSFAPLVRFWKQKFEGSDSLLSESGRAILENIEEIKELNEPLEDWSAVKEHKEAVRFLLSAIMPPGMQHSQFAYVSAPFNIQSINMTDALAKKLETASLEFTATDGDCRNVDNLIIKACTFILDRIYGFDLFFELPVIFTLRVHEKGIYEYYKSIIDMNYVDIIPLKKLPKPDEKTIRKLLANVDDTELWLNTVQPQHYEFRGLVKAQLIDITEEEALSRLKYKLLEKDSLVKEENIRQLEQLLRNYFRCSSLDLGISALDYQDDFRINHKYKIRHHLLADEIGDLMDSDLKGSIIPECCKKEELMLVGDLKERKNNTSIEKALLEKGYRSVMVAPLEVNQEVIGIIQLGSDIPHRFNSLDRIKMQDILPLFSTSMERSRDEIDNQIDSIIREQYTSIHPSVEWKFVETAFELLNKRENDPFGAKPSSIVFNDVFPFFAESDIASSSTTRNRAIQKDLVHNLELGMHLLEEASQRVTMPIISHYLKKTRDYKEKILLSVNSSDEVQMINFIKDELEPIFEMVTEADPEFAGPVQEYHQKLDPALGIIYSERKAFEDSVALINDTISSYLDVKEDEIQRILPHYFEKYKTDGVEFEMYIGQSLMRRGKFHEMHMRNMRIWQLILLCDIARLVKGLEPKLPIPLETSQLILVHSSPLSIRFRMDEKRFDVDGAYNVRYEIIKKRIDKALIRGTGERLTVPGTVSVIYTQEDEKPEYEEYISFLRDNKYIRDEVEHVELETTQGVDGLKAFRLQVNYETDQHELDPLQREITAALQEA